MTLQPHSAALLAKRNIIQRATKYVKYGNIGGIERLIKGKSLSGQYLVLLWNTGTNKNSLVEFTLGRY